MFKIIKKITTVTMIGFIVFGGISTALALDCPVLSAELVKDVIENADIYNTRRTLIDESGLTPQEIIAREPTANPFDTYFEMASTRVIKNMEYIVAIDKILGKNDAEVRYRIKKILLNNEKEYRGKYDPLTNWCIYKTIYASPTIPNYPFKSRFETIVLSATDDPNITKRIAQLVQNKYR